MNIIIHLTSAVCQYDFELISVLVFIESLVSHRNGALS